MVQSGVTSSEGADHNGTGTSSRSNKPTGAQGVTAGGALPTTPASQAMGSDSIPVESVPLTTSTSSHAIMATTTHKSRSSSSHTGSTKRMSTTGSSSSSNHKKRRPRQHHVVGLGNNYFRPLGDGDAIQRMPLSKNEDQDTDYKDDTDQQKTNKPQQQQQQSLRFLHIVPTTRHRDTTTTTMKQNNMESLPFGESSPVVHIVKSSSSSSNGNKDNKGDADGNDNSTMENSNSNWLVCMTATATVVGSAKDPKHSLYQWGTMHGRVHRGNAPLLQQVRLPLNCLQLSSGRRHVVGLLENGVVVSWGAGHFGQLGHVLPHSSSSSDETNDADHQNNTNNNNSDTDKKKRRSSSQAPPTFVAHPTVIQALLPPALGSGYTAVQVSAGSWHSAALVRDRSGTSTRAFVWGSNRRSQCGIAPGKNRRHTILTTPVPLPQIRISEDNYGSVQWKDLQLARLHSVGLSDTGQVYSWGWAAQGRCGHGYRGAGMNSVLTTPKPVEGLKDVVIDKICVGDGHNLALTKGGRVFTWGTNGEGQCGHGHTLHLPSPRLVGDLQFSEFRIPIPSSTTATTPSEPTCTSTATANTNTTATTPVANNEPQTSTLEDSSSSLQTQTTASESSQHKIWTPPQSPHHYVASPKVSETLQRSRVAASALPELPLLNETTATTAETTTTKQTVLLPEETTRPKIVQIYASGNYSAAVSSVGDLYTWGDGDANQLGHVVDPELPLVEPGSRTMGRIRDTQSFDSNYNCLLPRRVDYFRSQQLEVDSVCVGPTHLMVFCSGNVGHNDDDGDDDDDTMNHNTTHHDGDLGKTLFDLEQERWSKGRTRLRAMGSARVLDVQRKDKKKDYSNAVSNLSESSSPVDIDEKVPPPTTDAAVKETVLRQEEQDDEESSGSASSMEPLPMDPYLSASEPPPRLLVETAGTSNEGVTSPATTTTSSPLSTTTSPMAATASTHVEETRAKKQSQPVYFVATLRRMSKTMKRPVMARKKQSSQDTETTATTTKRLPRKWRKQKRMSPTNNQIKHDLLKEEGEA
eukprot:scaffold97872_cov50-Attheya_sp.AAC.1